MLHQGLEMIIIGLDKLTLIRVLALQGEGDVPQTPPIPQHSIRSCSLCLYPSMCEAGRGARVCSCFSTLGLLAALSPS